MPSLTPGAVNSGIPSNWVIDWRRFHEVEGPNSPLLNFARALDTKIAVTLFNLPIPSVVAASPNALVAGCEAGEGDVNGLSAVMLMPSSWRHTRGPHIERRSDSRARLQAGREHPLAACVPPQG